MFQKHKIYVKMNGMKNQVIGRRLLFVEDDVEFCNQLKAYFEAKNNEVVTAHTIKKAREALCGAPFDAIVLDLLLPDGDGIELLDDATDLPPVLILTTLNNEYDMMEGFTAGACDYALKPCSPELLEMRLSLRLLTPSQATIEMHGIVLDLVKREGLYNGKPLKLTGSEFNILHFFMTNAGQYFRAETIYEKLWHAPSLHQNSIKYHIFNLRKKLTTATGKSLIEAEYGKGYVFVKEQQ